MFSAFAYLLTGLDVDSCFYETAMNNLQSSFFTASLPTTVKTQQLTHVMGICIETVQGLQEVFTPHKLPCFIVLQHQITVDENQ